MYTYHIPAHHIKYIIKNIPQLMLIEKFINIYAQHVLSCIWHVDTGCGCTETIRNPQAEPKDHPWRLGRRGAKRCRWGPSGARTTRSSPTVLGCFCPRDGLLSTCPWNFLKVLESLWNWYLMFLNVRNSSLRLSHVFSMSCFGPWLPKPATRPLQCLNR